MRYLLTGLLLTLFSAASHAQIVISGTVLDNSKKNYVESARVESTSGMFCMTDSLGHYSIIVHENDSLFFTYNNKPTQKFAVKNITNPNQFDISLRIPVQSRYNVLKEVIVYSKSFKQDSLENRQTYADVFDYKKPGLSTSVGPGGTVGADVNELINVFRFRRNKRLKAFQQRLEEQEKEKYISYRFNKITVKRVTGLSDAALDTFMIHFRPTYEFAALSDEVQFNQYLLNASSLFKKQTNLSPAAKKNDD
ncbi:hypothetical protein [Ferruginibacter sp. HRS2-29]|uniref:hypothetical protein n=1 Tax=Ferruginibacter sp. HRS2-29 TaxID=2487334 RepID=UPI0020CBE8A8|nr:hypothetical protein [Ferruginibacter sp. HRS2-29]MCP9749596.1 hypothetical protein [Ferruginibacter sp. HRS2-29]